MNDAELHRLARAARDASVESVDVAGDLRQVHRRISAGEDGNRAVAPIDVPKPRGLRVALVGGLAAAALVAAVVAVDLNDEPTVQTNTPDPTSTAVPTTTPAPSSTIGSTTAVPSTATPAATIAVDVASPPPLIEPVPLVSLPLESGDDVISVAIGEREIAVRHGERDVTLVDYRSDAPDGPPTRTLEVAEPLTSVVLGPDDVLYGFGDAAPPVGGSAMPEALRYVAVALSGPGQGEVIAENRLDVNRYLELPAGAFGLGPDGVVARLRDANEVVAGYVDSNGDPTEWTGPAPVLLAPIGDLSVNPLTIDTLDGSTSWTLDITRAPDNAPEFAGPTPPAPTTNGRVVFHDRIGSNLTGSDFGPSAMPVIAILEPGGSGSWVRLLDEWSVVASEVWGTVLMRTTETTVELALLDDALPGASDTASSDGDALAVGYRCETDATCTQLAETSGGLVAYDPIAETLTLLDRAGTAVLEQIPLREPLAESIDGPMGSTQPALVAVGPDDVVYFTVWPPGASDPIRDLVAVPTNGPDAGTVITIAEGLDGSGDSELVPTPTGLAVVGCCGNDSVRPAADAQIFGWIGSDGEPATSDAVYFEMGLGEIAGLARIDPTSDTPAELELPGVAVGARGMPHVVATDDGGALMQVFDWLTNRSYLARLGPNDTVGATDAADIVLLSEDTTDSGEPVLLERGGTIVARLGDRLVRRTMEQLGTPGWTGRLTTDLTGDVWTAAAPGLNDEIDARRPEWATDPLLLARQLVPRLGPAEQFGATWDAERSTLTVTVSNFLDDSTYAAQYTFELEQADDGLYRVLDGTYSVQCQPNRGHQDFQPKICT